VVDLLDFSLFQACFQGPGRPPSNECAPGIHADLDLDTDVDLDDFARFYPALTANYNPWSLQPEVPRGRQSEASSGNASSRRMPRRGMRRR
jgi:hypothetical protein